MFDNIVIVVKINYFYHFRTAHKSSKKLLEQCQKLDKVWGHIFNSTITLTDNTDTWYRKVREVIDKQQIGALWMSESKVSHNILVELKHNHIH